MCIVESILISTHRRLVMTSMEEYDGYSKVLLVLSSLEARS